MTSGSSPSGAAPDVPLVGDARELKGRLLAALGDGAATYWATLAAFCSARIDRAEFDTRISEQLPDEYVPLHNALILSILAHALEPAADATGTRHAAHGIHAPASPIHAPRALLGDHTDDDEDDTDYDPPVGGTDSRGRKRLRHMYAGLSAYERTRLQQLPLSPGVSAASAGWAGAGAELLERKRKEDEKRRSVEERRRTRETSSAIGALGWRAAAMGCAAQAEAIRPRLSGATQEAFARGVAAQHCVEAQELPDVYTVQDRMTLCAVEAGLAGGVHVQAAAVVLDALQEHLRNIISSTLAKVRPPRAPDEAPQHAGRMAMPDMTLLFSLAPHVVVEPLGQGALERLLAPDVGPRTTSRDGSGVSWAPEDALADAARRCATTKRAESAVQSDVITADLPEDPADRARYISRFRQQQRRDAMRNRVLIDELAPMRLLDSRAFAESLAPNGSSITTPISAALAQHYHNVSSHYSHHHTLPNPNHRHKDEYYEVADSAAVLGALSQ